MSDETKLVPVTVNVPKESNDVRVAVTKVLRQLRAKKSFAEIAVSDLQELEAAVSGYDKIPAEAQQKTYEEAVLGGLLAGEIIGTLLAPLPPQP